MVFVRSRQNNNLRCFVTVLKSCKYRKYIILVSFIIIFGSYTIFFITSSKRVEIHDTNTNGFDSLLRHNNNKILVSKSQQLLDRITARDYINQFNSDTSFRKKLNFFHIPKTAGTAIEHAAGSSEYKISWGSCMFNHKRKRGDCQYPPGGEWPDHIGWWHIPSHLYPLARINPYSGGELFGVIRHPYDRMISEFYYICTLKVFEWRPDQCDRDQLLNECYMNTWLIDKMKEQNRASGKSYLMDNGHFTSQYDFVFAPFQVRMLDYVLTMDDETKDSRENGSNNAKPSLVDQFNTLMDAFQLSDIRLVQFNSIGAVEGAEKTKLTINHLNNVTIQSIHTSYDNDFLIGNYDKISPRP